MSAMPAEAEPGQNPAAPGQSTAASGQAAAVPSAPGMGETCWPAPCSLLLSMIRPPDRMVPSELTLSFSCRDLKHLFDASRKCQSRPVDRSYEHPFDRT